MTSQRGAQLPPYFPCSRVSTTRNSAAVMLMPRRLATAEPTSPKRLTSSGSATAPGTSPHSVSRNGSRVFCTPRIQPLPAMITSVSGTANALTRIHVAASAPVSAWPDSAVAIGSAKTPTMSASTVPTAKATHVACTPSATASSRRPAPKKRELRAVVPYERNVSCVVTVDCTAAPAARAASSAVPRRPTTAVSSSR